MRRIVAATAMVSMLLGIAMMLMPTTSAVTRVETKTKFLSTAGEVRFTSSFKGASDAEIITVRLEYTQYGYLIDRIYFRKSTPSRTNGYAVELAGTNTGTTIQVQVFKVDNTKTLHLWMYLASGEHVGVNIHF